MITSRLAIVVAELLAAVPGVAASGTAAAAPTPPPHGAGSPAPPAIVAPDGMELVWSDEFDGDTIDPSNWTFDIGAGGWGNGEAQYYTDRPENARIEDGSLVIELRQEQYEGSYYTSARLTTLGLGEFQYGRIEARLLVPRGAGTWPAFWALGADFDPTSTDPDRQWPHVGEIDIMEHVGREPDLTFGTIHGPGYSGAGGLSRWNRRDHDIADDFHTFAVEWDAGGIEWFYDGESFYEIGPDDLGGREWVFDRPFFLIVNLALGGTFGGNIALDLQFPLRYEVDYVRVFQEAA